jgi:ribose 1,5-bisphosphokinase PhnN
VIEKLERLIGEIGDLNSKLILLVGPSRSGKTQLLRQLGAKLSIEPLNVGLELGRRLAATPNNKRSFSAGELLREIVLLEQFGERTETPRWPSWWVACPPSRATARPPKCIAG